MDKVVKHKRQRFADDEIKSLKPVIYSEHPRLPEETIVRFVTNGFGGGDAGHGGFASLVFEQDCGCWDVSQYHDEGIEGVEYKVRGDWEISSFIIALINLGKFLEEIIERTDEAELVEMYDRIDNVDNSDLVGLTVLEVAEKLRNSR